jgi:DNA (cytosine-5)-methyltransferase 1
MKHLGDITKINGAKIEHVDAITFGSPCQDLSVAGKREGLDGERSGLFLGLSELLKK